MPPTDRQRPSSRLPAVARSSEAPGATKARTRLAPDARREELLIAARGIVEARGAAALSMTAVADAAGVSKPLVYLYFENLSGLLLALFEKAVEENERAVRRAVRGAGGFEDRVRSLTGLYLHSVREGRSLYHRLLTERTLEKQVEEYRRRRRQSAVKRWEREIQAEYDLPAEIAAAAAILVVGSAQAAADEIAHREVDVDLLVDMQVRLVMSTLDGFASRWPLSPKEL